MATNFNTNPFGIYAHPLSGSLKTGSAVDVINFINSSPFFTSSKQADAGSIAIEYSKLGQSGSGAGAAADIVFKVAGKEYANKNATEVLRISATGSSNEARIGIGMGKNDTVDSIFHVKGETLIDGNIRIKSGSETITVTKDDLKDIVQGKAVSDSSGVKNAARGGLTQTFAANALVNLADSSTLVKANETGKLELKANNLTLIEVDATDSNVPVVNIGDKPAGKVLMTGSLEVTGSNVTFDVEDLLTLLGNFGQTGSFAVSGSSEFTGDVNMDGAVTTQDLLTVVAGFGATGSNNISGSLVIDNNHSGTALSITGSTIITGSTDVTGSFGVLGDVDFDGQVTVNDLMVVLANYSQTGSFNVQGDTNLDGIVNTTDLLNVLSGFSATGSNDISGSLVINDNHSGTALSITGSTNVSGSSVFTGSFTASGSVFLDGATTVTDILNAIAGFEVSGSTNISGSTTISGSLTVKDEITANSPILLSAGTQAAPSLALFSDTDTGLYFPALSNVALQAGGGVAEVTVHPNSISLQTATGGSNVIVAKTDTLKVTASLSITGSQVDFTSLPSSDPGVAGRLYQTSSEAMGMTAGKQVVLISA